MSKKLADRIESLEKKLEALGPLAHAREIKALAGKRLTGGVLHSLTWAGLALVPAPDKHVLFHMSRGGQLAECTVNEVGIHLRFLSGQNVISRAYLVP